MAEKTELFQVRAQLERNSSTKLDEMLSIQKSASDRTGLGYGISSSNIASTKLLFLFLLLKILKLRTLMLKLV